MNNFDRIAPFYDQLARIVFGSAIQKAQCFFLDQIRDNDTVLVLGGGTGWIVDAIMDHVPTAQITFIDNSKSMIEMAKNRIRVEHQSKVAFVEGEYFDRNRDDDFDVIFSAFYLDMFSQEEVSHILTDVSKNLKKSGKWIFTDFRYTTIGWQRYLLKLMYFFFKVACGVSANKLANFDVEFMKLGLKAQMSRSFYFGMIESVTYSK